MGIVSLKRRTKLRSALVANTRWGLINPLGRGLFGGGVASGAGSNYNVIDYIMIATTGNATDFGDISVAAGTSASNGASTTRGLFNTRRTNGASNDLEYVTIATTGNTTGFGNLTQDRSAMGTSSSTRAVYGGGESGGAAVIYNTIDYVTIASTGNATDFGDLTNVRYGAVAAASPVRAVWAGGNINATGAGATNIIDYVTIESTGNAIDFGDLTAARDGVGGASNNTRALFMSGILTSTNITNIIDYITIASTGNAIDFGDISSNRRYSTGLASATRCVFSGGLTTQGGAYSATPTMEYVTIATTGNSTTFGDLTVNRWACGTVSASHGGILPEFSIAAAQAFFASGSGPTSTIETVDISSLGDTVYFGELTQSRVHTAAAASSTRAVWAGGASTDYNIIDYITMATAGNATDFGDLRAAGGLMGGCSSSTRAIFAGGSQNPGASDYITIASTGNSLLFGNLSTSRYITTGAVASTTRGVWGGGADSSSGASQNVIDYVTIASTGNALDFGDLTVARYSNSGSGSSTRGLFSGGYLSGSDTNSNVIDYITIASTGNATDFGDLTAAKRYVGGTSSSTRALVAAGGITSTDDIEYVTISSTGNSAFFGNLTASKYSPTGTSNAHGGL